MAVTLPTVSRCCFCFSLRTGCLIIGYVSIVASLLVMSSISFFLYRVVIFVDENQGQANPDHPPEELAKAALGVYVSQAYYLLICLSLIVISVMMLVGIHANKPHLLRYYVYIGTFLLVNALVLVVLSFVFVGFYATLPLLKWCVTHFICLLVVRSTHLEMEERNKPPVYEMQNLYNPPAPMMA